MTQDWGFYREAMTAGLAQGWHRMRLNEPSRVLFGLALVAILVLLVAFVQVARQGVRQGEMRRVAMAARADAVWRCNATIDRSERERCQQELDITKTRDWVATNAPS